jgi:hypothetical protein
LSAILPSGLKPNLSKLSPKLNFCLPHTIQKETMIISLSFLTDFSDEEGV